MKNEKSGGRTPSANANALAGTPEANSRSSTNNSITENAEKSNPSDENSSKKPAETSSGKRFALTDEAYLAAVESGDMDTEAIANYSEKEYNSFGWARANDVLSIKENERLRSLFADAVSEQSNPPKTKAGEYMIAIGENVENKIAYMTGKTDSPVITRILKIDEYNETTLSEIRSHIYATERKGIRQQTGGIFVLHTRFDFRDYATLKRSSAQNAGYNNQLGAERGTGSGATAKAQRGIQGPYLKVVHSFTDITGRKRNVIQVSSTEYMIEGDSRSKYQPTVTDAVNAENERIIARYAKKKDKTKAFVKAKLAVNPDFIKGFRFAITEDALNNRVYSKEQYESFGWASEAEGITTEELDDLYSKIQARTTLRTFKQSSKGEAIIEVNKKPHTTLDVDNVFVFVKGTKSNFAITRVVRFAAETETEMEILREDLYEGRTCSDTYLALYQKEGIAREYRREDSPTFAAYREGRSNGETSRGVNQNNRQSGKYRSGYSLTFGEDGEILERFALTGYEGLNELLDELYSDSSASFNVDSVLERGLSRNPGLSTLTVGEMKKTIANNTHYQVFSKSKALEVIGRMFGTSDLTAKTRAKLADALSNIIEAGKLHKKLSRRQARRLMI